MLLQRLRIPQTGRVNFHDQEIPRSSIVKYRGSRSHDKLMRKIQNYKKIYTLADSWLTVGLGTGQKRPRNLGRLETSLPSGISEKLRISSLALFETTTTEEQKRGDKKNVKNSTVLQTIWRKRIARTHWLTTVWEIRTSLTRVDIQNTDKRTEIDTWNTCN